MYVQTERDKDFIPQAVQFDIRADQYRGMLDIYLQQLTSHCGFSPTSIFPFLADGSNKTATEVSAEENLTRSTVQSIHQLIEPTLDRVLDEVLYQFYRDIGIEYTRDAHIKLSDYIGNPLLRDENTRKNYESGLMPRSIAVQKVNGTSDTETKEYLEKIDEDERARSERENSFPSLEIPPGLTELGGDIDEGGVRPTEPAGFST